MYLKTRSLVPNKLLSHAATQVPTSTLNDMMFFIVRVN